MTASQIHEWTPTVMRQSELTSWLKGLKGKGMKPGPSGLDGFLTALVIGPRFVGPDEWIHQLLRLNWRKWWEGTPQSAAIQAVVERYNAIGNALFFTPDAYEPLLETAPDGCVLAGPWSMGFLAAMKPRLAEWHELRRLDRKEHALLLPILLHCTNEDGSPMLGPPRKGSATDAFLRDAWRDIRPVVFAIREFWMPQRVTDAKSN
jgi:uncharacterized protein